MSPTHFAPEGLSIKRQREVTLVIDKAVKRMIFPGNHALLPKAYGKAALKIWRDFFHEIHNEPEWMDVAAFVVAWIENAETPQAKS
jgi:alpha-beta hydrolase superfamily lysophospholipase